MADIPSIASLRKVYKLKSLREEDIKPHPIDQFEIWWNEAIEQQVDEPNAMTLATCTASGRPSARTVLLKGVDKRGFVFYTNYESRKAREIEENAYVALLFFWKVLERQVRIEGTIQKVNAAESDEYFSIRPRESQLGAWSSPQSSVIESAEYLQRNLVKYAEKFKGKHVTRPDYWGGYLVQPDAIEFWQGRPGRLHDRLKYFRSENNDWIIHRLAP
ncbi:MAG: pyridoxamine 5'-phosphate oxidase [Ginsengibacter sp.]